MAQFLKTWQRDIPYMVNLMAQIPVIVDQNVFYLVKFRQEGIAWRVAGPNPTKNKPFFQQPRRDRAIGLIYYGTVQDIAEPITWYKILYYKKTSRLNQQKRR